MSSTCGSKRAANTYHRLYYILFVSNDLGMCDRLKLNSLICNNRLNSHWPVM